MSGTAFTAPGYGATVSELWDAIGKASTVQGQLAATWNLQLRPLNAKSNLVLLPGAVLTPDDMKRIAECVVAKHGDTP